MHNMHFEGGLEVCVCVCVCVCVLLIQQDLRKIFLH